MNTNTNELVSTVKLNSMDPMEQKQFTPVPRKLRREAEKQLDGKDSVIIPKGSNSQLARWAHRVRRNQNKKGLK